MYSAKLNGLDLTRVKAQKADNLSGVDFTGATNAPEGMLADKYIRNSKLHGLDLEKVKVQKAYGFEGVDFTGAINAPEGLLEGKYIEGAHLHGLDLGKVKAQNAVDFKSVDFTGAFNIPVQLLAGKSANKSTLSGMDIAQAGLDLATEYEHLKIKDDVTMDKEIYLNPNAVASWDKDLKISYKGTILNYTDFLRLQHAFGKLIGNYPSALLPVFVASFLRDHGGKLEELLKLGDATESIDGFAYLTQEALLEYVQTIKSPSICQEVFKDFQIHPSWKPVIAVTDGHADEIKYIYLKIIKKCIFAAHQLSHSVANIHSQQRYRIPHSYSVMLNVNRKNPQESLQSYFAHLSADGPKAPRVNIQFLDEFGVDAGGLKREFFDEMAEYIKQQQYFKLEKSITAAGEGVSYKSLGQMAARARTLEDGIAAFPIDADLKFYEWVLQFDDSESGDSKGVRGQQDLVYLIMDKILSEDDSEILAGKNFLKSLKEPISNFLTMMVTTEDQAWSTLQELVLSQEQSCDHVSKKRKIEHKDKLDDFAQGMLSVVSLDELKSKNVLDALSLKKMIEGEEIISKNDFLQKITFDLQSENEEKAYRQAISELLDENASPQGQQEFIRRFLKFATGSSSLPQDHITLRLNSKPGKLPASHTCSSSIDCPKLEDVKIIKEKIKMSLAEGLGHFGFI